ncbi:MAG: carbohydrate kinase family protein [Ignavibacteriae bacterium]|nr:carbohydrate kinase family protein [Ignavibacteriota bacterium]
MKYLVIGEPCVDLIHKADGEIIHSYGGILYSVISLAVLAGKEDLIYPVMNLGSDEYENITNILKRYPNIKLDGIYKVSHPTRKVNLYYNMYNSGNSARIETSTEPTYTIGYDSIEKFLRETDAILINMISGVDITLDTLKNIRKNFNGFIHIDIHNLVMKTNPDGTREHTNLEGWREWCSNTDTVQMNEFEITTLSKTKKIEYEVAEEILINMNNNVKGIIVTRGKNGISGFTKKEKSFGGETFCDLDKDDVSAIENPHFVDSTGCGDVFAASFTLDFSKNENFKKSLHYSTRIASFNTSLEGIGELYKLK